MSYVALLLQRDASRSRILTSVLKVHDFVVVNCATRREFERKGMELLPHLLIADLELAPETDIVPWIVSLATGPLMRIPFLLCAPSLPLGLPVDDYLLRPFTYEQASEKVREFQARLAETNPYVRTFDETAASPAVELRVPAGILSLTEASLHLDSPVQTIMPGDTARVSAELFSEIGLRNPTRVREVGVDPARPGHRLFEPLDWRENDHERFREWSATKGRRR